MSSFNYYLIGPVQAGVNFILTYYGTSRSGHRVAYFLTEVTGTATTPDTLVFDPRIQYSIDNDSDIDSSGTICTLTASQKSQLESVVTEVCKSKCSNLSGSAKATCLNVQVPKCESSITPELTDYLLAVAAADGICTGGNSNGVPIGSVVELKAAQVKGGWTYSYTNSNNILMYMTVDSNGNLSSGSSPATFSATQNEYADWSSVPFLSGVGYSFTVNGNQVLAQSYQANMVTSGNVTIVTTVNSGGKQVGLTSQVKSTINAVPAVIYNGSGCGTSKSIQAVQIIESTWAQTGQGPPSYTTLSDCQTGVRYSYCSVGSSCGTNNCRGPCSAGSADTCQYNTVDNGYVCKKAPNDEPWWQQWWFIMLMVLVGILFFILIITLIVRFEHRPPK